MMKSRKSILTLGMVSLLASSAFAEHPWGMRNATPARTGQSSVQGATLGVLGWRFPIAGVVPQIAVAQDGSVYLGSVFDENSWSNEQYVYALTAAGALKWRQKVMPYDWGASQGTRAGPAIDAAGSLVVPSAYTQLLKMTDTGDALWTYQGSPTFISNSSPAVLPDDTIRTTIWPAGLLALAPGGSILFTGPGQTGTTISVAANGEMAGGGIRTQEPHGSLDISYFNADGTLRWSRSSANGAEGTPVFGPDGIVYAPFLGKAFFPDGTVKWTTDVGSATAALARGVLFFPSGGVVAVDAVTGVRLWTLPLPGGIRQEPAIDSAGNIFVTATDGRLWSISSSGSVNWSLRVCDTFLTGPVIGSSGNVIAAGKTGYQKFVFSVR